MVVDARYIGGFKWQGVKVLFQDGLDWIGLN